MKEIVQSKQIRRSEYFRKMIVIVLFPALVFSPLLLLIQVHWVYVVLATLAEMSIAYAIAKAVLPNVIIPNNGVLAEEMGATRPPPSDLRRFQFTLELSDLEQFEPARARILYGILIALVLGVGAVGVCLAIVPYPALRAVGILTVILSVPGVVWIKRSMDDAVRDWQLRQASGRPDLIVHGNLEVGILMMIPGSSPNKKTRKQNQSHQIISVAEVERIFVMPPDERGESPTPTMIRVEMRTGEKIDILLRMSVEQQRQLVSALINTFPKVEFELEQKRP